jgi:hypothetical protein
MFKKITTIIILCFTLGIVFNFSAVNHVSADSFKPQVDIGVTGLNIDEGLLGRYIQRIYVYSIGFVGMLACVVLMMGGFLWITAGGNGERVGNAKAWIGASLSGLVLALCSYTLLYMINPKLVSFKPLEIAEPDLLALSSNDQTSETVQGIDECNSRGGKYLGKGSDYKTINDARNYCNKICAETADTVIPDEFDKGWCCICGEIEESSKEGCCLFNKSFTGNWKSCENITQIKCKEKGIIGGVTKDTYDTSIYNWGGTTKMCKSYGSNLTGCVSK